MDAVIIAVAHKQFRKMPIEKIRNLMNRAPVLIDVRGMIDRDVVEMVKIYYRIL